MIATPFGVLAHRHRNAAAPAAYEPSPWAMPCLRPRGRPVPLSRPARQPTAATQAGPGSTVTFRSA